MGLLREIVWVEFGVRLHPWEQSFSGFISANHLVDQEPILVFQLANRPGILSQVAKRFGQADVNIDYIYGSAMKNAKESIIGDLSNTERILIGLDLQKK